MTKQQLITAIDIGSSKITTVIASYMPEERKTNVIGVANVPSRGFRKSQVVDIEEAISAITKSVEAAERMAGVSISHAFTSVGGSHIESQNSKGVVAVSKPEEEIVPDDVDRVIEAARAVSLPSAREILHVIPRDFMVDSQSGIKDPLGMTGVRLEVETHIITGSSTAIRNLTKCITELGIDIAGVVFSGLASAEAVLTETEKELGVCLVDIGGGTTSIAVYVDGALSHSSVLPVGAKNITNDLAIGLRISLDSAEKIKIFLSNKQTLTDRNKEKPAKADQLDLSSLELGEEVKTASLKTMVDGIIRPRLNEIFAMVGEELNKSGFAGTTPAGIVLTGGGSQTVEVVDACKRTLSLPVRVGLPSDLTGLVDEISSPQFAVVQGLIHYGLTNNQGGEYSPRVSKLGRIGEKIPLKGTFNKIANIVKSFLP
jgi:cell division protein FtsA